MNEATGTFDVQLKPQSDGMKSISRMAIEKRFHGDLEATSEGQMLASQSQVKGSAGYVAVERVTGTLKGRRGSFVLIHTGMMERGNPSLSVTVVPDSGTEELAGLRGTMHIDAGETHSYRFEYSL